MKFLKANAITKLNSHARKYIQYRKYSRLIIRVRAKKCIQRGWRAYCARNVLYRIIRKRKEDENRIKKQLKRLMYRFVIKIINGWREQTKIMRFARMMGAGNTRKRKKELLLKWRSNVTWLTQKRPICATKIQKWFRRYMNIKRWILIFKYHTSIKPIQKMVKSFLIKTMCIRMKKKKQLLMLKVRKRMRAETDRLLKI